MTVFIEITLYAATGYSVWCNEKPYLILINAKHNRNSLNHLLCLNHLITEAYRRGDQCLPAMNELFVRWSEVVMIPMRLWPPSGMEQVANNPSPQFTHLCSELIS